MLGVFFGILIFFSVYTVLPKVIKPKEIIGRTGRFTIDTLPEDIQLLAGQGLTKIGSDGVVEPALADSWETPDSGKTWVFTLKDGLTWQDGDKLVAGDINYSFSDVETRVVDDKTIEFKLVDPFSPFPSVVSKPIFKKGLLGTGQWRAKDVVLSGNIILQITFSKPDGEKRIYKFFPSEERTKLAYKLGTVDKVEDLLDIEPFANWKTVSISEEIGTDQVVTLFFNTKDAFVGDKSARQALSYAIDKQALGERAYGPISPSSWAYNPQVKTYLYDTARAKELLDTFPDEVTQSGVNLATTPALLSVAEKIASYWEDVGIHANVQVASTIPSDYQAYLAVFEIPKDPDQYSVWHSTQEATNISNFANPRIDKLLEDGRTQIKLEDRKATYLDFQRFLVEDTPAAFLYHPVLYTVGRK